MNTEEKSKLRGILITASGSACWGMSGCFGQYLLQNCGVSSDWLVCMRLIFAGILLMLIGFFREGKALFEIFRHKEDMIKLLIFSLIGVLFSQWLYFLAIEYSNAGTATVLQATAPVFILFAICVSKKLLPTKIEAVALLGVLAGTTLLTTHGDFSTMQVSPSVLFFGLGAAVAVAFYNMSSASLMRKYSTYCVVGFGMLIAAVPMSILSKPWQVPFPSDPFALLMLAGVILIGTAVAYSLYLYGVSKVGPFLGSLLASVEPITAILFSALFLNTSFHPLDFVGFLLVLSMVTLLSVQTKPV